MARKTYEEKLEKTQNPVLKKLFQIIIEKKSNLCVAVNFKTIEETIEYIDRVGKHVCMIKTQTTRYIDGELRPNLERLYKKKKEHNFLLFEDIKLCDGCEAVGAMYEGSYIKYVDLVTVVPEGGDDVFTGIQNAVERANLPGDEPRGCLAIAEYSFAGRSPVCKADRKFPAICAGIIAQDMQVSDDCSMIKATPGVNISKTSDGLGQRWKHPSEVVKAGADIVIVGRGITLAPSDQLETVTCEYKNVAFKAYKDSLSHL